MNEVNVQTRLDEVNQKLDLLLHYVDQQRLRSEMMEDLVSDISIIGKDIYHSAVVELENHQIEIDPEQVRLLILKLLGNINNFSKLLGMFESVSDLMKDLQPIVNEVLIDTTHKFHELEQKGYFEFLREMGNIADNIVTHFTVDDVRLLADNIVNILETVKNLTQPEMLRTMNNAVTVFQGIDFEDIPEYSMFQVMRELRKPQMKKGMGFMITFLKNMAAAGANNQTKN
ncbi:MAG TPA: DUF1641 domain-containing protein [Bacteroidales bacterium]|nr:DUF1641 domain-containing protein [Bacteroidales bacterium]